MNLINNFIFPSFTMRTPLTLICKIITQNLISQCRALLSLQPILHADTQRLDQRLTQRVHKILGFPFCLSSKLLTLPLELGGFDFLSISRINTSIAVDGLVQDLNHHIPAYQLMATVMLADWTCQINGWCSPT